MRVAGVIAAFVVLLFTGSHVSSAQPADKVARIGFLGIGSRGTYHDLFEQALRERGWVSGKHLAIVYRHADGKYERLPALAAELAQLAPQAIVAVPTASARAAKNATSSIPIIMSGVADPIGEGLIASFARPGGNVTGVTSSLSWDTYAKQLQLITEAVPHARRVALLRDPANPGSLSGVKTLTEAARARGLELQVVGARTPDEFEAAFRAIVRARADALVVHRESAFLGHLDRLTELSIKHRLPSASGHHGYAKAGGLMTYAVNSADEPRHVAAYVDKILRGANPAELPVEQPTKFELIINRKTARALGLAVPATLVVQAEQVLE